MRAVAASEGLGHVAAARSLGNELSSADDRVRLNEWLPPQAGVVPRIRIGHRWVNVLWPFPLTFLLLVIGVAVAQALRELPAVQSFLVRYPGVPVNAVAVTSGFPAWLRLLHFLNLFFMTFIVRAGVQILADHPRLYWKRDCTPGTEWFRFQKRGSDRSYMDRQGRLSHAARLAGYPGYPSFHRPCPMVALFDHSSLDD